MTLAEATEYADRMNELSGTSAEIVRILLPHIDPIVDGDSGWDVEITVGDDE